MDGFQLKAVKKFAGAPLGLGDMCSYRKTCRLFMAFPYNSSLPVHHRNRPLHPNFGEPGHGCLPKQITNLGGRSPKRHRVAGFIC